NQANFDVGGRIGNPIAGLAEDRIDFSQLVSIINGPTWSLLGTNGAPFFTLTPGFTDGVGGAFGVIGDTTGFQLVAAGEVGAGGQLFSNNITGAVFTFDYAPATCPPFPDASNNGSTGQDDVAAFATGFDAGDVCFNLEASDGSLNFYDYVAFFDSI
ncbi:MAG: hypothetical protein AAF747_08140, partial [Planctomycetota bacterium]